MGHALILTLIVTSLMNNKKFLRIGSNFSHLVKRSEWNALPPQAVASPLQKLPPEYVVILHTASTFCRKKSMCIKYVQNIQSHHVHEKKWKDIAYNFLVGGDGYIYEGRGWDVEGAHTVVYGQYHNQRSLGIAFIGNYENDRPTPNQIEVIQKFFEFGVSEGKLDKNYSVYGQCQLADRISPGKFLYEAVKLWEHWKEYKRPS